MIDENLMEMYRAVKEPAPSFTIKNAIPESLDKLKSALGLLGFDAEFKGDE